jgi:DNA repair/transcription protein MET18/MMS19
LDGFWKRPRNPKNSLRYVSAAFLYLHRFIWANAEICGGSASLPDVVKALGEYLTAEEDELRIKGKSCSSYFFPFTYEFEGVEFLSAVLHTYPPEKLNRQSGVHHIFEVQCAGLDFGKASVLTVFYCHKLEDTETIVPALKGLAPLVKCQANGSDCAIDVLRA